MPTSPQRRAEARRLINWTGERCVPWAPDVRVVHEHLHRYLWAARIVEGRKVLDLGSGEGFGANILAGTAQTVDAIELDADSFEHSRLNYVRPNLSFALGDARDLSRYSDGHFGAVVAFEMIEHVAEQAQVVEEIARVLAPDGIAIVSTPERCADTSAGAAPNPFHVHELTEAELDQLLGEQFKHVALRGQRTVTGSAISRLPDRTEPAPAGEAEAFGTFFVEPAGEGWQLKTTGPAPQYLIALASHEELRAWPSDSTLLDPYLGLLREVEHDLQEEFASAARAGTVAARAETQGLREQLAMAEGEILDLKEDLAQTRAALWRVGRLMSANTIESLRGRLYYGLGGPGSPGVRAVQLGLRGWARLTRRAIGPTTAAASVPGRLPPIPDGPIRLTTFDAPDVSIVIPLHARADLTRRCLHTIIAYTGSVPHEVILIDDSEDPGTRALLAEVKGARIITNPENRGYLRSVNVGAAEARGRWLVLANNDIEVTPGWLEAMLGCAAEDPQVAIVTPRYIYPDGSLCEAGAIVWRDGTGWNYGRGGDPDDPRFAFRREVDYGSAAALLVRRDFWQAVGGFDERFRPMYFEDVDLCFAARERGLKVVYEPRATVLHHEGSSAGTNTSFGHKRHQVINRPRFVEKWSQQLERAQLPPDPSRLREAADRRRGPHVLVVDHRVPTWDRDSGSLRMFGMLQALLDLECRVTLLPDNLNPTAPYTERLQAMGVEVLYGAFDIESALADVGRAVRMVILCRPEPASRWINRVRRRLPTARIVYDTVDLHWLREARRSEAMNGGSVAPASAAIPRLNATAAALREMETSLFSAADATLVVTEEERRLVAAEVSDRPVIVVPNVHRVRRPVAPLDGRRGVVFVGGFEHPPNLEAALRLIRQVMPTVWAHLGEVPLKIAGDCVPGELARAASTQVEVMGWVPELERLLDGSRALVAPMTYGAGLKGKVTQALAAGLPVVTTRIGAEGLDAVDGEHLLIADDDAGLAERVRQVLVDDELWARLSRAGQELCERVCSPAIMEARLAELLWTCGCPAPATSQATGVQGAQPTGARLSHSEPPPSP